MDQYVLNLIDSFGYFGMFLGMILEAVIIDTKWTYFGNGRNISRTKNIFFLGGFFYRFSR